MAAAQHTASTLLDGLPRRYLFSKFLSISCADLAGPTTSPGTNRLIRRAFYLMGISLSFATGYMLATNPTVQTGIAVLKQPTDAQTLELMRADADTPVGRLEAELQSLPLVQELSKDPRWQGSRPHLKIPQHLRPKSFTGGHLLAEDKIPVPPLIYTTGDGKQLVGIVYLGPAVCGHPGIVHGGLLATLMDEGLARTCFAALPNKVGVTANLNVNYRLPCKAGQFVVLRGETIRVDGRKAWVKGRIETLPKPGLEPKVLVEGDALFVEPRGFASRLMRIAS